MRSAASLSWVKDTTRWEQLRKKMAVQLEERRSARCWLVNRRRTHRGCNLQQHGSAHQSYAGVQPSSEPVSR